MNINTYLEHARGLAHGDAHDWRVITHIRSVAWLHGWSVVDDYLRQSIDRDTLNAADARGLAELLLPLAIADHQTWLENARFMSGIQLNLRGADLTGADLRNANLTGADLRNADLTGAHLTGAHLRYADLRYADLRNADLRNADLTGAHLTGAHLTGANLTGADLRNADLTGAHLTGAHLRYADLRYADLRNADLTGAKLNGAHLTGADLFSVYLRGADLTGVTSSTERSFDDYINSLALNSIFDDTTIWPAGFTRAKEAINGQPD